MPQAWALRILVCGPDPITGDWITGQLGSILRSYFTAPAAIEQWSVPIVRINPGVATDTETRLPSAVTAGPFNGYDVPIADPRIRQFSAFSWTLVEKAPMARGTGPIREAAANDVRLVRDALRARLQELFGDNPQYSELHDGSSSTGYYHIAVSINSPSESPGTVLAPIPYQALPVAPPIEPEPDYYPPTVPVADTPPQAEESGVPGWAWGLGAALVVLALSQGSNRRSRR